MYTSYIGQKFLEIYNRKENAAYSAEEFFDKILFPLFFNDERHLMHVANSPFFQTPSKKELKESGLTKSVYQYQRLKSKVSLVTEAKTADPDASVYVGFAANGPDQTTAGQVSNLKWEITSDELYASWIGSALAVRVEGSQCLLIDSEPVLWHLYQGWEVYRRYMEPVRTMTGRQIETWNGYWLSKGGLDKVPAPPEKGGKLDTSPWLEVVAKLLTWHSGEVLPAYIFSLGQTNTTYGFINIHLPQLKCLREARHAIKQTLLPIKDETDVLFWEQYEPELSLRIVCQMGEIGLRGLQPKGYVQMMESSRVKINEKNRQTFANIQTWILAMLNNKSDLQKLAAELANELVAAESTSGAKSRGKTSDTSETRALFDAKGLTSFVAALADFVEKRKAAAGVCRAVVDQSVRIPPEQLPLFKALLRFEYVFLKNS